MKITREWVTSELAAIEAQKKLDKKAREIVSAEKGDDLSIMEKLLAIKEAKRRILSEGDK